jgi:fructose/tagatose bisphosphate aldolase
MAERLLAFDQALLAGLVRIIPVPPVSHEAGETTDGAIRPAIAIGTHKMNVDTALKATQLVARKVRVFGATVRAPHSIGSKEQSL